MTEDWSEKWLEPDDRIRHLQGLDTGVAGGDVGLVGWLGMTLIVDGAAKAETHLQPRAEDMGTTAGR